MKESKSYQHLIQHSNSEGFSKRIKFIPFTMQFINSSTQILQYLSIYTWMVTYTWIILDQGRHLVPIVHIDVHIAALQKF